jgi:hypothetical protein
MSKARVDWIFGEIPVQSTKMDQITTDWITNGVPIMGHSGFWSIPNLGSVQVAMGWYPYNEDKSVHNALRLLFGWTESTGSMFSSFQISLDTGGTWNDALSGSVAPPVDLMTAAEHMVTHSLTGITGSQWIGFRIAVNNPDITNTQFFLYFFQAFLYNTTDTPF